MRSCLDDRCLEKDGALSRVAHVTLEIGVRPSTVLAAIAVGPAIFLFAWLAKLVAGGSALWFSVSLLFPAWVYRGRDWSLEEGGHVLWMAYGSLMLSVSLILQMFPSFPFIPFCRAALVVWLFAPQTQAERLERCCCMETLFSSLFQRMPGVAWLQPYRSKVEEAQIWAQSLLQRRPQVSDAMAVVDAARSLSCDSLTQPAVANSATERAVWDPALDLPRFERPGGSRKRVGTPPPTCRGVRCEWMCKECVGPRNFVDMPLPPMNVPR